MNQPGQSVNLLVYSTFLGTHLGVYALNLGAYAYNLGVYAHIQEFMLNIQEFMLTYLGAYAT